MYTIQILSIKEIGAKAKLNSVTCDNNFFYFTESKSNKIYKYSLSMDYICCFEAETIYVCICYDKKDGCFWAASRHGIVRLDKGFKETGRLEVQDLTGDSKPMSHITDMNYDLNRDILVAACHEGIIELDKQGNTLAYIKLKEPEIKCCSAVSLGQCYLYSHMRNNFPTLSILGGNENFMLQSSLPAEYYLKSMTLYTGWLGKERDIYILASLSNHRSCLIKCRGEGKMENDLSISLGSSHEIGCDWEPCKNQTGKKDHENGETWEDKPCKKESCHTVCRETGCDDGGGCNRDKNGCCFPCNSEEGFTCVMESIALLQATLSYFLNMEAKEIQKILEHSESAEEILTVNAAVKDNITKALHLEQLFFTILDTFNEMIKKETLKKH